MCLEGDLDRIGRVKLVGFPGRVDSSTVKMLSRRALILSKRMSRLDEEIGFTYPPIEIVATCFTAPWEDTVIFAKQSFRGDEQEGCMVVKISAPTMLAFCDDQIDAILAHEFLHYVWATIDFMSATTRGDDGTLISNPNDKYPAYMKSEETYETLDRKRQVKDSDWLPPRLVELSRKLTGLRKDEFITQAMLEPFEEWRRKNYPIEQLDPDYKYSGPLSLDDAVVQRARQLRLLTQE